MFNRVLNKIVTLGIAMVIAVCQQSVEQHRQHIVALRINMAIAVYIQLSAEKDRSGGDYRYSSVFNLVHQQDWEHIVSLGIAVSSTECSARSGTHRSVGDSSVFNRVLKKIVASAINMVITVCSAECSTRSGTCRSVGDSSVFN